MSCLSIRLPPAKRAWKSFISNLLNLHKSKAIKKQKTRSRITSNRAKATIPSSTFFDQPHPRSAFPKKTRFAPLFSNKKTYLFKKKKKSAPVYIDKLFKEPDGSSELVPVPITKRQANEIKTQISAKLSTEVPRTSKEKEKGVEKGCTADEMWESMGFASPQMQGIDERAEEFIARIKAEMKFQEMMARRL